MAANDDDNILTLVTIDEIRDWGEASFAAKSAGTASGITSALGYVPMAAAQKGAAGGVAELDEHGLVLSSQLPASLALGETGATAYRGDRGAAAYSHASAKGQAYGSGLYKITTNAEGHVVAAVPATMEDLAALGAAASNHAHSASDVTSGTLAVERGGTGASTAAGAASAIVDGNAIAPESVAATGAVTGASVGDADGTLADLRDSVSWELVGTAKGTDPISLPAAYEELKVVVGVGSRRGTVNVLRDELPAKGEAIYTCGGYLTPNAFDGAMVWVSRSSVHAGFYYIESGNKIDEANVRVYARG